MGFHWDLFMFIIYIYYNIIYIYIWWVFRRFLGISSIFTIDPEVLGFFCETSSPHPMEIRPEQLTGLKIGRALFVGVHRLVGGWLVPNQWDQRFHLKGRPAYSQGRCVEFCWRFLTCYSVSTVPRLGWCLQENAYFSLTVTMKVTGLSHKSSLQQSCDCCSVP